jgi:hypothetical protein
MYGLPRIGSTSNRGASVTPVILKGRRAVVEFSGSEPPGVEWRVCDGVAKADVVELHLDPCGETTKTRAAIVSC